MKHLTPPPPTLNAGSARQSVYEGEQPWEYAQGINIDIYIPSKHEALANCWADVGPSSTTLAQHQPNIGPTPRVC